MSVAGGLPLAIDRAIAHRCDAFQIFAKNANRWVGRLLGEEEIRAFRTALEASGLGPVVSHASYLINLASSSPALRHQSIDAMGDEIDRAEALGLLGVVLHPGCYTSGRETEGLQLIADGLLELFEARSSGRTMVILEQTAGQGTALGTTFEQLESVLARASAHPRLGICLDTCHLLAAGYDIRSEDGYHTTFESFVRVLGLERLKLFHMNDSKTPLGSRVDRHEHIGKGHLGLEPFRRLVNDSRFAHLPMLLETPKSPRPIRGLVEVDRHDRRNLKTLRSLIA